MSTYKHIFSWHAISYVYVHYSLCVCKCVCVYVRLGSLLIIFNIALFYFQTELCIVNIVKYYSEINEVEW